MGTLLHQASAFLTAERSRLAAAIVDYQYSLQQDFWRKFGEMDRAKSLRDEEFHLAYLAEALSTSDPCLFLDYLQWCKVFFSNLRFPDTGAVASGQASPGAVY